MTNHTPAIFSTCELADTLGNLLQHHALTCAVAESCTGGMVGAALTAISGSSAWFKGGIIAYCNELKAGLLDVPESALIEFGAVSAPVVIAMAQGAARICSTPCAVSLSGIAGPKGGTTDKPVGLVYIGVCVKETATAFEHHFSGDRDTVRRNATNAAIQHLIDELRKIP